MVHPGLHRTGLDEYKQHTDTVATRAVQAGIDLVALAAMLGHSKINMVLRYAHPTQEHQTTAMDKMEQYVSLQKIADAERSAPHVAYTIQ